MVYALVLGTSSRKGLRVRVSPAAQIKSGMWRNWYTRMLQEHMRAISWEFKSPSRHINKLKSGAGQGSI